MNEDAVLKELQGLEKQRAEALANLHRIDGAIRMCQILLAKEHERRQEEAKKRAAESEPHPDGVADEAAATRG